MFLLQSHKVNEMLDTFMFIQDSSSCCLFFSEHVNCFYSNATFVSKKVWVHEEDLIQIHASNALF